MVSPLHVVAGALVDPTGRVLIAERPAGKAHAGRWEFPGGKLKAAEPPREGLARELAEELGIEMLRATPLLAVTHHYPGAAAPTLIDCWTVDFWRGQPSALDGQALRWCTLPELAAADILEADRAIVTALLLPRLFLHVADGARAARPRPRSGAGDRVGWLLEANVAPPAVAGDVSAADLTVLIDPAAPPPAGTAALYTSPVRWRRSTERTAPSGCVVAGAAEARAAGAAGADFLAVLDARIAAAELHGIAAAGLPWYLNVAEPGTPDGPVPTGRLWWRAPGSRAPAG